VPISSARPWHRRQIRPPCREAAYLNNRLQRKALRAASESARWPARGCRRMKNQYFGDIHDYRKYGLLRALQSTGDGNLLVVWMLTPDDRSRDGGFRSYLETPPTWANYDPDLFAGLTDLLRSASQPSVSLIESSGLLPRARYHTAVVPDGRFERDGWRKDLLRAASGVDLVFLDPDNGIEVPSKRVGRKDSSKYATWQEIEALWEAGCSLLIYQHFRREAREAFAQWIVSELGRRTGACFVEAFRTPHVLFLLAAQNRHAQRFGEVVQPLSERWNGQLEAMALAPDVVEVPTVGLGRVRWTGESHAEPEAPVAPSEEQSAAVEAVRLERGARCAIPGRRGACAG
jgi:hypothetical protein